MTTPPNISMPPREWSGRMVIPDLGFNAVAAATMDTVNVCIGLEQLNYEAVRRDFFAYRLDPDPIDVPVYGGVVFTRTALARHGVRSVWTDYPDALLPMLGRRVWAGTMGEARKAGRPLFWKPMDGSKAWTGHVYDEADPDALWPVLHLYDPDRPCWLAEPVRFVGEWRAFVHRGEVRALRQYKGPPFLSPDWRQVTKHAEAIAAVPAAAWCLDLGLTDDGRVLLVEANDGHSFGTYDAPSDLMAKMVMDRWWEMVGLERRWTP